MDFPTLLVFHFKTYLFLYFVFLMVFLCVTLLRRIGRIILGRRGDRGHLAVLPDINEQAPNVSPLLIVCYRFI